MQKTGRKFIERVEGFEYERDGSKVSLENRMKAVALSCSPPDDRTHS